MMISLLILDFSSRLKAGFQQWVSASKNGQFFSRWNVKCYLIILLSIFILGLFWWFDYQVLAFGFPLLIGIAYILVFKRELSALRRITWILFGIGLSITLFVEVFVLKGDTGRANTVFKFYIQAWFVYGLAMSLALIELLSEMPHWSRPFKYVWWIVLGGLLLCAASYPLIATGQKMTDRWPDIQNPPHSLDGAAFYAGRHKQPGRHAARHIQRR